MMSKFLDFFLFHEFQKYLFGIELNFVNFKGGGD